MLRLFPLMVALLLPPAGMAQEHRAPRPLASAFDAMAGDRWERAAALAARDGPAAARLIEWFRLRDGQGTPDEILAFLRRNGHWPGLDYLREESEKIMAVATTGQVLEFFDGFPPQTGTGALAYGRALVAAGRQDQARDMLVHMWRTLDLTTEEHHAFLNAHAGLLAPHHAERLDMALWRGLQDVELMLPLVPEEMQELAGLRRDLDAGKSGAEASVAALTQEQRADPGLNHARFNNFIRTNQSDKAIDLLVKQSRIEGGLGQPERWASWRRWLGRSEMRSGNTQRAYDIVTLHQLKDGANYADLEWLAGYIALKYMEKADLAVHHFKRLQAAVSTPISLGRAGYWLGRAYEAAGNAQAAQKAYEQGAEYQTSFYGLLAAEKAGVPPDPSLASDEVFPSWTQAGFRESDLREIGMLLLAMDRLSLAERFVVAMSEDLDHTELGQLSNMLEFKDQSHLQVMVAKAAATRGIVLHQSYYPVHPLVGLELPVPAELALAIARRESEFDPGVVSPAGAQGLMQLMPGTARDMAAEIGVAYDRHDVLNDWSYNARLGSAYLAGLVKRFDGNPVMMAAGYNAGPRRPDQWMEDFGDPRAGEMDIIDWIEHIPFRETRNYVMRVTESLPVYRARLGKKMHPVPFSEELAGRGLR